MTKLQKTISIEYAHDVWIKENGINLSACVRDLIEEMMADRKTIEKLENEQK